MIEPAAYIKVHGRIYPAAVCQKCGLRLYPPSGIELHVKQHGPDVVRLRRNYIGGVKPVRKWEASW